MEPKTLRFRARGDVRCPDFSAPAHFRRYVGRAADGTGWPSTGQVQEVAFDHHFVRECAGGHLWAADAETAEVCGVKFDPTFGGELKKASAPAPDAKKES